MARSPKPNPSPDHHWTVPEVAKELGVTERTVWRWLKEYGPKLFPIRSGPKLFLDSTAVRKLRHLKRGVPLEAVIKAGGLDAWKHSRRGWDSIDEIVACWRVPGSAAGLATGLFGDENPELSLVEAYDRGLMILLEWMGLSESMREHVRYGDPVAGVPNAVTLLNSALLTLVTGFEPVLVATRNHLILVPKPAVGALRLPGYYDPRLAFLTQKEAKAASACVLVELTILLRELWKHWERTTPPGDSPNGYLKIPVPAPEVVYEYAPVVWDRQAEGIAEYDVTLESNSYDRHSFLLGVDVDSVRLAPPTVASERLRWTPEQRLQWMAGSSPRKQSDATAPRKTRSSRKKKR